MSKEQPKKLKVTISFIVDDPEMYEYIDGYKWLWKEDRGAAMDAFYEDDEAILEKVEALSE